jgi:hypothetical protein
MAIYFIDGTCNYIPPNVSYKHFVVVLYRKQHTCK